MSYVALEGSLLRSELLGINRVLLSEFFADGDFLVIGETHESHGGACQVTLSIRRKSHDRVRRNRRGLMTPLAEVERT